MSIQALQIDELAHADDERVRRKTTNRLRAIENCDICQVCPPSVKCDRH